jgi:hypothetical protein
MPVFSGTAPLADKHLLSAFRQSMNETVEGVAVIITNCPGEAAAEFQSCSPLAVDPIEVAFAASLNQPGLQPSGVTNLGAKIGPKRH